MNKIESGNYSIFLENISAKNQRHSIGERSSTLFTSNPKVIGNSGAYHQSQLFPLKPGDGSGIVGHEIIVII